MLRRRTCQLILLAGALLPTAAPAGGGAMLIPVVATARVEPAVVKQGEAIPLSVTVSNGLKGTIRYAAYSLKPNGWNGETVNLTLVDITRNGMPGGLFLKRPKVEPPAVIAGVSSHAIKAGASLTLSTDARQWAIRGGWVPGKYKATVRVERLSVDDDRCLLSVHSAPFEFEIR